VPKFRLFCNNLFFTQIVTEYGFALTPSIVSFILGLQRKHTQETYTLLRLCFIKFSSADISLILVDYQGREWHGQGPVMLPPFQSHKLHSAPFETLSLIFGIPPHHDFGLASGLKWPKVWATLSDPKRYAVQIPETVGRIPQPRPGWT